ncbi:MAG: isoprenyl transferase [Clostridia bacterium]|nr:isoprenyl transferase [Clostridia bacterium]
MIDMDRIPESIAVIMDGNGRWAKKRFLPRVAGHNAGMLAMKEIIKTASTIGVKHLTVYAFSTENWKRTEEEVSGIFKLLVKYVDSELDELHKNNVRVRILGDYSIIPKAAKNSIEKSLATTAENTGLQFNIALNYGSRAEIVRAVNRINEDIRGGKLEADTEVTEELLSRYLYTGDENGNIPDPDLIIRTSGEERLSNFLLWQSAYSEFAFTDVLWPDFTPEEFKRLIEVYQNRDRRFGGRK